MDDKTKQSILDAGLIIPKQEVEDVEITYDREDDMNDTKEFIIPKEELSNSSLHLEDYKSNAMPVKTENMLNEESSQVQSQEDTGQGESALGYVEVKSSRRRHAHVATERVIDEVHRRPALWDLTHALYKDRDARIKLWVEVFVELFPDYWDVDESGKKHIEKIVQQRWKTARDAYIRCKNILKKDSSDSVKKKVYGYFDDMRFLDKIQSVQEANENNQTAASTSSLDTKHKSKHDTKKRPNCKKSTSNRDTSISNSDIHTVIQSLTHDTVNLPNLNAQNSSSCDLGVSNCDNLIKVHDSPGMSSHYTQMLTYDTQTNHDATNVASHDTLPASNQDFLQPRHFNLDLIDNTASPMRAFTENHSNNIDNNKLFRKRQRKRKLIATDDFEKEMLLMFREHTKLLQNDDMTFFMSLLPITKNFSHHQKLIFRSEILKKAMEIGNMHNPYESIRLDPSHSSQSEL